MPTVNSPDLQVNKKIEGDAPDAVLNISVDPRKALKTGSYTFQLQVLDDAKNASVPATFTVVVIDDTAPTAVITGPERVPFGKGFALSGERSSDPDDGKIVHFTWTLIKTP